jgi:hypothetical protein
MVKLHLWGLFLQPIEPPPDLVVEPDTWERWCCDDERVSTDDGAKCEAYLAWCKAEQKRRFDDLLQYNDAELANDQSEQAQRWRDFALSLAAGTYSGLLTIPDPRPPRKRPGKKNVDDAIIEAVSREWERAGVVGQTRTAPGRNVSSH